LLALGTLGLSLASCQPDVFQGRVLLSGSATLAPTVEAGLQDWKRQHSSVEVRVDAIGSDAGLERLIRFAEADVALLSRPITDDDRARAAAAGQELLVLPLAWDAVCLVVPSTTTWVANLSRSQARQAFTTASRWSDLDPTWPEQPLERFVLGPRSGTSDLFAAALLDAKADMYQLPHTQASEDDRILARGLARTPGSLGFLGWTTVREAGAALKVLAFEGVVPSDQTIRDHRYALTRPLVLVTTRALWRDRPVVRSIVRSLYQGQPPGVVPLSESEQASVRSALTSDQ